MIGFAKKNAQQAADRLYRLYSGQMLDGISVGLGYPHPEADCLPPLIEPQPDDGVTRDREPICWQELPVLLEISRRNARLNSENPDDSLPAVCPVFNFEGGIETMMLGGRVRWVGTRLHTYGEPIEPLIRDYADFDWALPDEGNVWLQRYLEAYRYLAAQAKNDFALSWQGGLDAMNFAVQLRGAEQAYVDMHEEPDNLRRLLDYALQFNLYLYGRVAEIVGSHHRRLYGDHPLARFGVDRQPMKSIDAYSLCRPGTLREWGREQFTTINNLIGGAVLHIHENSRHMIEEVTEIPGWRLVWFSDGVGYPRSFDLRWELRRRMKNIPIAMGCNRDEFLAALDQGDLPGNTQYGVGVDSLEEAKAIMDKVMTYRAPETARKR